jgi:hypothetical protein
MKWIGSVFLCGSLLGQVTSSSISGYVFDPSGATVPRAALTIKGIGISRTVEADSAGHYAFRQMPRGSYTISAIARGFGETKSGEVSLLVDSPQRLDLTLAVAQVGDVAQVTVSKVQTQTSEIGAVIDRSRVEALPLNSRDFLQLSLLVPGVMPPVEDSELSSRGAFAMHANGAREEFNNFLLDGVDNNDPNINRYNLQPPVDAIQEFKLATNAYSQRHHPKRCERPARLRVRLPAQPDLRRPQRVRHQQQREPLRPEPVRRRRWRRNPARPHLLLCQRRSIPRTRG